MKPKGSKEWAKYNHELKLLRAKQKAGGLLRAELERLAWLEELFGEAAQHERIQIEDPTQTGPTTKTSADHYATDISQDLLKAAQHFTPQKKWERDAPKKEAKFKASDPRAGQATFRQKGLGSFAIDLSEDLRDQGFDDELQQDQTQPASQADTDQDEPDLLLQYQSKPANGQNPFAVALDEDLKASLVNLDDQDSAVSEAGVKSFDANLEDPWKQAKFDTPDSAQSLQARAQELLSQSAQGQQLEQDHQSIGQATTHRLDEAEDTLDLGLIQQALEYAEEHNLVDDDPSAYSVDEQGREVADYDASPTQGQRPTQQEAQSASEDHLEELPDDLEDELVILDSGEFERIESSEIRPIEPVHTEPAPEPWPIEELEQIPDLMTDFHSDHEASPPSDPEPDLLPALDDGYADNSEEFEVPLWIDPNSADSARGTDSLSEDREPTQPSPAPDDSEKLADMWESPDPKRDFFDHRYQNQGQSKLPPLGMDFSDEDADHEPVPADQDNQPTTSQGAQKRSEALMDSLFDDNLEQSPTFDNLFGDQPTQDPIVPPIQKSESTDIIRRKTRRKDSPFQGPRRVTVHFKDGVNRRGIMRELDPAAKQFELEPKPNSNEPPQRFEALALKAIFVMLPRGNSYPPKTGTQCKITMIDGRQLEGYSDDYDPSHYAFTLLPKTDRGNIERVLVFLDAIKNIYFE